MRGRHAVVLLGIGLAAAAGGGVMLPSGADVEAAQASRQVPLFAVDPAWPQLPNKWVLGQTPGIAVDRHDHVWILHRPRTVPEERRAQAAPPVLEFDERGRFVNAWGGPGSGFDWPDSEHGIFVDYKDNVWIGGSSPTSNSLTQRSDDMLVKFTSTGKFLLQIGGPDRSKGNSDRTSVNKAADVFVFQKTNEVFVADGYGNRRVVVFDADTGAFKRMWGAFGNAPVDAPQPARGAAPGRGAAPAPTGAAGGATRAGGTAIPAAGTPAGGRAAAPNAAQAGRGAPPLDTTGDGSPQFGGPVHSVKVSNDGMVYVADRPNRRIQLFDVNGKYQKQVFVNRAGPSSNSVAGLAFSPDREQRFLYAADYGNSRLVVLDRATLDVLYQFGGLGEEPGRFRGPHHVAADSKGNLYVVEVSPGNRAQRFVYKGPGTSPPPDALK